LKDYTEIVDVGLAEFESDISLLPALNKFKLEKKAAMRDRELLLRRRGLSDEHIIQDLIVSENMDIKNEFLSKIKRDEKNKAERRAMIAKVLLAVIYFMIVGMIFFLDEYINEDFEHSWLIPVAGILFFVIFLFLMPNRFHYGGRRFVPVHYALMISTALVAVFVWLIFEIVFKMEYSIIIMTIALSIITFFDAVVPWIMNYRHAVAHTVISLPLCGAFVYLTVGFAGLVPWRIGWLIIIAAIALAIGVFLIAYNRKYRVSKHVREVRAYELLDTKEEAK